MRTSSVWLAFLIIGCGADPVIIDPMSHVDAVNKVDCALGGARAFVAACTIERGNGTALTLRHRDGGFRRLMLKADGVFATADGAETVNLRLLNDGRSEIIIGEDRYRLPERL